MNTIKLNNIGGLISRFHPFINYIEYAINMMPTDYSTLLIAKYGLKGNGICESNEKIMERINVMHGTEIVLKETDIEYLCTQTDEMFKNINRRFSTYYSFQKFSSYVEYLEALKLVRVLEDTYYGEIPEIVIKRKPSEFKKIIFKYLDSLNEKERKSMIYRFSLEKLEKPLDYDEVAEILNIRIDDAKEMILNSLSELKKILEKE